MSISLYAFFIVIILPLSFFCIKIKNDELSKSFTLLLILISSILFALRPIYDSVDTIPYNLLFNDINKYFHWNFAFGRTAKISMENWFVDITKLLSIFSYSSRIYFFYISVINQFLLLISIKKCLQVDDKFELTNISYIYFLAYPYFIVIYSSAILRAGICIPFCIFSYTYFTKKKYAKALFALLFGIGFHLGALIFGVCLIVAGLLRKIANERILIIIHILIFVLYLLKFDRYLIGFICSVLNFICSKLPTSYLLERFRRLLVFFSESKENVISIRNIIYYIQVLYILLNLKNDIFIKCMLIVGGLLILFFSQVTGLSRITDYCFVFSIVAYYKIIKQTSDVFSINVYVIFCFALVNLIQAFQILNYTKFIFMI